VNHDPQNRARLFVAQRANLLGDDFDPIDRQTSAQPFQRRRWRESVEDRFVLFFKFELRMSDAIEQFSVVRKKQQARRFAIEPADRNDAFRDVNELYHGAASALVRRRGDVAGRFIQHDIAAALPLDDVAVNPHHLTLGIDLHPQLLNDVAINADASIDNHLLGFSSRRQPIRRNHTLKTFQDELRDSLIGRRACHHPLVLKGSPAYTASRKIGCVPIKNTTSPCAFNGAEFGDGFNVRL
jgi:hypothetical protein